MGGGEGKGAGGEGDTRLLGGWGWDSSLEELRKKLGRVSPVQEAAFLGGGEGGPGGASCRLGGSRGGRGAGRMAGSTTLLTSWPPGPTALEEVVVGGG